MNHKRILIILVLLPVLLFFAFLRPQIGTQSLAAPPGSALFAELGTAFTYQGYLTESGFPVDGPHDFKFDLYSGAFVIGTPLASVIVEDVSVDQGLFISQTGSWALGAFSPWLKLPFWRSRASRQGYRSFS